jgi:imidazole glycerol-phosphate synthase subunit HisH
MIIGVLDYGLGNFSSIIRMIEKAGGSAKRISTPKEILKAEKIILPGVGHFDRGMSQIVEGGLLEPLKERVIKQRIPLMGICLGMQLLCNHSDEGVLPGLRFVDANVRKFQALPGQNLKIPHMGWNSIQMTRSNPLIEATSDEQRFYFVHSYYVVPNAPDMVIATATHGVAFCAAFQSNNIFGVQFHPEKSHRFGMVLLKNFVNL